MKNVVASGFTLLVTSSLVACGGGGFNNDIKQAVSDNQTAESLLQWEQSPANPEKLFIKWQTEYMTDSSRRDSIRKELCEELLSIEPTELTLFETEINSEQNGNLVADCKTELVAKLDAYYEEQRATMEVPVNAMVPLASQNNFKFASNVQKRDLSNGYFARAGDVGPKEVVLTFDDGPSGVYTESILRSLKEVDAKAIFFLLGRNVDQNPEIVKKVAADGHAVGSHSANHACLNSTSACRTTNGGRAFTLDESLAQIRGGHQSIQNVLGWVDPFFRFPYGESSTEMSAFLKRNQVGEFHWNIDSEDWKDRKSVV